MFSAQKARLTLLSIACLALHVSCRGELKEPRPDVLLISLDSVRADFLNFADAHTAPHLTELARRGTVFTQAISGTSWTLPSHAQMFTGMPPSLHGLQEGDLSLDPVIPTLPELLSNSGYSTAGFYTCWYLAGEYGFSRGFGQYSNSMRDGEHLDKALSEALASEANLRDRRLEFRRWTSTERYVNSPQVAENAVRSLQAMGTDDPAFIFAHFFDPHFDYIPPKPFDEQFDPTYDGSMTGVDYWENPNVFDAKKSPPRQISDRDLQHIQALYRGEIAWTDQAIGSILEALEERGTLDNTLIIVTADHGEEFFEHGNRGHRQSLFDEVLRVPLLIVPPVAAGVPLAPVRNEQVSLSDLLPTILDYTGVVAPSSCHGRSLRPAIEDGPAFDRPLLSSLVVAMTDAKRGAGRGLWEALRTPSAKLLRLWTQFDGEAQPSLHSVAYYDLAEDPEELLPVKTFEDPRVRAMWKLLEGEMSAVRVQFHNGGRTHASQLLTEVHAIVGDDLAHLGYAGSTQSAKSAEDPNRRLGVAPLPASSLGPQRDSGQPTSAGKSDKHDR